MAGENGSTQEELDTGGLRTHKEMLTEEESRVIAPKGQSLVTPRYNQPMLPMGKHTLNTQAAGLGLLCR